MELNENEQMVLSTMSVDISQALVVVGMLSPMDFEHPLTQTTYAALHSLVTQKLPLDDLSLAQTIRTIRKDASEDFLAAARKICESGMHTDDITYYAKQVRNKSINRSLAKCGRDIILLAQGNNADPIHTIATSQEMVLNLSKLYTGQDDILGTETALQEIIQEMALRRENPNPITGLATGFWEMDENFTAGFQNGDLIILAARPSMGKTAFMLNIMENVCMKQKKLAYIFSLEMNRKQLLFRLLSSCSGIPSSVIQSGDIPNEKEGDLSRAITTIKDAPLFINDSTNMTVGTMQLVAQKTALEHGKLDLICVDYLQLMSASGKENRTQELSEISRGLKNLARQCNCPVLALSQLSRAVDYRQDKRPMLSDLRESGAIEQDADLVMFLYRDEYYTGNKSESPGSGELIIAKQRNGPVGDIKLYWNPVLTQYISRPKEGSYRL